MKTALLLFYQSVMFSQAIANYKIFKELKNRYCDEQLDANAFSVLPAI